VSFINLPSGALLSGDFFIFIPLTMIFLSCLVESDLLIFTQKESGKRTLLADILGVLGKNESLFWVGKTGEERNLVIFKDTPMKSHINGELSTRPFLRYGC